LSKFCAVSLFDLDRTLVTENSSYLFGSFLYRRRILSSAKALYCMGCYSLHAKGLLSLSKLHNKIFASLFQGKTIEPFYQAVHDFLEEDFARFFYQPALRRVKEAQDRGHYTAILSSSPSFLVERIARLCQVDEWMATSYASSHGIFSEVPFVFDGKQKSCFAARLVDRLNLSKENMTAYSDSYLDMPFLESAGTAVGVNPDRRLKKICLQRDWEIL
jgi:HAD superfamily phosphoserine phosphatase-like hydrolase